MTNQTIDGVPRDDLELVLLHGHSTHESDLAWDRLHALLDAPAVQWLAMEVNGKPWVIKEGPNADKWRAMGYELYPVESAAQPQGEPVAWAVFDNGFIDDHTVVKTVADEWAERGLEVTPLYAEQPEPVAVVMPERKTVTAGLLSESNTHNHGWNACLDEATRLNTK